MYSFTKEIKVSHRELKKFLDFIYASKGIDLNAYRENFLSRRLYVRMLATKAKDYLDYAELIKTDPVELNNFFDALSINTTDFFRNPDVFASFQRNVLTELIQRKQADKNRSIRIWSAGCAAGQEAYSLAILIREKLLRKSGFRVSILGTDVDNDVLEKANKAEYKLSLLKNVRKEVLEKYFIPRYNNSYCLKKKITGMVRFRRHNLIEDPPLKFTDIVFCRNVLIYLNPQQQDVLFNKFCQSLNPEGYLVIGKVETIRNKDLFKAVDLGRKIYKKIDKST